MEQKPEISERKLEKGRLIGAMRSARQKIVWEGFPEAVSAQSTVPCRSSCLRCTGDKGLPA